MICNTIGLTTDSFETLYVHGGAEVTEVYGGLNYAQPIFYSLKTLTGATSYSFMGYPEPLKSCEISGNMVQNGTPTPTSPIYPQECGDRTANLWDPSLPETERVFEIEPNTKYTAVKLSPLGSNIGRLNLTIYDADMNQLWGNYAQIWAAVTCINLSAAKYAKVSITASIQNPEKYVAFMKTDDYDINIPYGYQLPINLNGTTQNLYLTEPLRKIGNYADSINSDGTVTRRIKKMVLDGTEVFGLYAAHENNLTTARSISKYSPINNIYVNCLSDKGNVWQNGTEGFGSAGTTILKYFWLAFDNTRLEVIDTDTREERTSKFKSYIAAQYAAGTPVIVWYVLDTPTTEQVTVPTLTPAAGNNTLAIGTTLQPSSLSITGHIKSSS